VLLLLGFGYLLPLTHKICQNSIHFWYFWATFESVLDPFWCILGPHCWLHFGAILEPLLRTFWWYFWDIFRLILVTFSATLGLFGIIFVPPLIPFGCCFWATFVHFLDSFWVHSGAVFEPLLVPFLFCATYVHILGLFLCHFWIPFGAVYGPLLDTFWCHFWATFGHILVTLLSLGSVFVPLLYYFCATFAHFWVMFVPLLGTFLGQFSAAFGFILVPFWSHFWFHFGEILKQFCYFWCALLYFWCGLLCFCCIVMCFRSILVGFWCILTSFWCQAACGARNVGTHLPPALVGWHA